MSVNLPSFYVEQFASNLALLLQQKGSKLRSTVMEGQHTGSQASPVDQIGSVAAQKVVGRFQPMGRVDASVDRRWASPADYDLPQLIDSFDKLRLLLDPQSAYVQNAVYAMGRAQDDEIINAYFGTALTGQNGGTNTSFLSGQQVAVNQDASSNTGLTVAKLRATLKLFMANEVDLDAEELYAVITAKQHDDLLKEVKVTNLDYTDKPVLVEGKVKRFLGINFIHCERIPLDASSYRRVPVYVKSGMHLGMWSDVQTDISQRKDIQSLPWQVYCKGTFGATRIEEKRIVEIKCSEA